MKFLIPSWSGAAVIVAVMLFAANWRWVSEVILDRRYPSSRRPVSKRELDRAVRRWSGRRWWRIR